MLEKWKRPYTWSKTIHLHFGDANLIVFIDGYFGKVEKALDVEQNKKKGPTTKEAVLRIKLFLMK